MLYPADEAFPAGGLKVLRQSEGDRVTVVAAGVTVHEAPKAWEELRGRGVGIRVIDLYSVKPVEVATLKQAAEETGYIITVEDHYAEGRIADAVRTALSLHPVQVHSLAVRAMPRSGRPDELLDYEGISWKAIVEAVRHRKDGRYRHA